MVSVPSAIDGLMTLCFRCTRSRIANCETPAESTHGDLLAAWTDGDEGGDMVFDRWSSTLGAPYDGMSLAAEAAADGDKLPHCDVDGQVVALSKYDVWEVESV